VLAIPVWHILAVEIKQLARDRAARQDHPDSLPLPDITQRLSSPRETYRTLMAAVAISRDDPKRVKDALACLDLSGLPSGLNMERDGGRTAEVLEQILRSLHLSSIIIPDQVDGDRYVLSEKDPWHVVIEKQKDGAWRFNAETVSQIPAMRLALMEQIAKEANQNGNSTIPAAYRSPRATYRTFVSAMRRDDLDAATRCLNLSELPSPARTRIGRELAIKLKAILDRLGLVLEQDIPDVAVDDPVVFISRPEGRIAILPFEDGDRKGQFVFGPWTVRNLERLFDCYEDKPIDPVAAAFGMTSGPPTIASAPGLWVRQRLPDWLKARVAFDWAGFQWWLCVYQIFALCGIIASCLALYMILLRILERLSRSLLATRGQLDSFAANRARIRPIAGFLIIELFIATLPWLDLRRDVSTILLTATTLVHWVVLAHAVYQLIGLLMVSFYPAREHATGRAAVQLMVIPMLALILRLAVVVVAAAAVLQMFDLNITALLTGLGISGLAFAFAAQDMLKNFFGSITLIADRTFYVGDQVRIGESEGIVESVGLRSTRLRGLDDTLLTIPNAELTTMTIVNMGARRFRRWRTLLTIEYGTPLEKIIAFRDGILDLIAQHDQIRKPDHIVQVHNLGSSAIEILLIVYFDVQDFKSECIARDRFILGLIQLAERLGVSFAFPTQTLHLADDRRPALPSHAPLHDAWHGPAAPATRTDAEHPAVPPPHYDPAVLAPARQNAAS
jgi:MscS family membrane protein